MIDLATKERSRVSCLFTEAQIAARVHSLAAEIAAGMGPEPLVVAVLKGSFVFAADLIRALYRAGMRPQIDFITLSSYGDASVGHDEVAVVRGLADDPRGRDVLLVDDILETGRTMAATKTLLAEGGARSVQLCVFLVKPGKGTAPIAADYCGFQVPDRFVVGYGLDYARRYRELPFVGTVETD